MTEPTNDARGRAPRSITLLIGRRLRHLTYLVRRVRHVGRGWPLRVLLGARVDVSGSGVVALGTGVRVDRDVWLHVEDGARLTVGAGSAIGRRCMLSAAGSVTLGRDVLLGPDVLIIDNTHGTVGQETAFISQEIVARGSITVEDGTWIGMGARIISGSSPLVIGRGSLIGAGATVRGSVPPGTVIPAGGQTSR